MPYIVGVPIAIVITEGLAFFAGLDATASFLVGMTLGCVIPLALIVWRDE